MFEIWIQYFKENGPWIFLLICILIIATLKIIYPFWNIQPVYHIYDMWRYLYWSPFIFYRHGPVKTKFYDPFHVKTKSYAYISTEEIEQWVDFIQRYYLSTDRIFCAITKEYIHSYMTGSNEPSFVSFYNVTPHFLNPANIDNVTENPSHPIGCIVSRPAYIYISGEYDKTKINVPTEAPVYFWDFICSTKDANKKICQSLIQTNEYNQRIQNKSIQISVFKKEVALCEGVVPFTQYKTRTYLLRILRAPRLPAEYECIRVYKENTQLLGDYLTIVKYSGMYECCLIPDFGQIMALIQSKILFVYLLRYKENICGVYFFKDLYLHYEDLDETVVTHTIPEFGNSIHCIASIQSVDTSIFYLGFLYSLYLILRFQPKYRVLLIEDIADNGAIIQMWNRPPIFATDTAYYFFNYFYPHSFLSNKCLLLM